MIHAQAVVLIMGHRSLFDSSLGVNAKMNFAGMAVKNFNFVAAILEINSNLDGNSGLTIAILKYLMNR
mgnify:CR=1 FL=1